MVSIKRFLNRTEEETILRQVVALLIERIGSRAALGDRTDSEAFRTTIQRINETVTDEATPETLLMAAGSATQAMGDYNQRLTRFMRRQGSEFQSVISMLTDTVVKIGGENTRFVHRLQQIGDGMERASALEDLHTLKLDLRDCLRAYREETVQQKAAMEGVIQALQHEVERGRELGEPLPECDAVTGLPKQEAAEAEMLKLSRMAKRVYAITMVVNRVQSINARFGNHVGDQVILAFKRRIETQFLREDQIFRWNGPALVALVERTEPLDRVRAMVKRLLDARTEQEFDVGGRSVLIPISAAWSAFQLMPPSTIAVKQIQTFIASQGSRDFA